MVISDMVYHYLNLLLIDNNDKQNDSFLESDHYIDSQFTYVSLDTLLDLIVGT